MSPRAVAALALVAGLFIGSFCFNWLACGLIFDWMPSIPVDRAPAFALNYFRLPVNASPWLAADPRQPISVRSTIALDIRHWTVWLLILECFYFQMVSSPAAVGSVFSFEMIAKLEQVERPSATETKTFVTDTLFLGSFFSLDQALVRATCGLITSKDFY